MEQAYIDSFFFTFLYPIKEKVISVATFFNLRIITRFFIGFIAYFLSKNRLIFCKATGKRWKK